MVATPFVKRRQQVPKPRDRAPKFINRGSRRRGKCGGSIDETVKEARDRRFGRGRRAGQRHRMDRLGTWEVPLTSTRISRQFGSPVEQRPWPRRLSDLLGAQAAR